MLFDDPLADVGPIANHLVWHLAVQTVGDASPANCVRAHARRTTVSGVPFYCLTFSEATVVRTLRAVDTWPCPAVNVGAQRRLVRPSFPRGQQRFSSVLVSD
jgi:hypothetical protein